MATIASRWFKIVCLVYFGDFGIVAGRGGVNVCLAAFAELNGLLGFGLTKQQSERGIFFVLLQVAITFSLDEEDCKVEHSISAERPEELASDVPRVNTRDISRAPTVLQEGGIVFSCQTAGKGRVG